MVTEHSTAVRYSAIYDNSPVREALETRKTILQLTQQAEEAVLKPVDTGCWSHSLRAALASRMAAQNELFDLADHYASMISDEVFRPVADMADDGSALDLKHVVQYMDRVTVQPRDVVEADINCLQDEGVSDADIVKLTELNAFMAYQVRLVAGLKLLAKVPA